MGREIWFVVYKGDNLFSPMIWVIAFGGAGGKWEKFKENFL